MKNDSITTQCAKMIADIEAMTDAPAEKKRIALSILTKISTDDGIRAKLLEDFAPYSLIPAIVNAAVEGNKSVHMAALMAEQNRRATEILLEVI